MVDLSYGDYLYDDGDTDNYFDILFTVQNDCRCSFLSRLNYRMDSS